MTWTAGIGPLPLGVADATGGDDPLARNPASSVRRRMMVAGLWVGVPASCPECDRGRSGDCQNRAVPVYGLGPQIKSARLS